MSTGAHPTLPEEPSTGDQTLKLALEALDAGDYTHSLSFVNEALEQGISWDAGKAEALNVRGTFKCVNGLFPGFPRSFHSSRFLIGDIDGAKEDLEESIKLVPGFTQSLVKIASVHMEQGDPEKAFECFDEAIKHNADDPDIYYHRGQGILHLCGNSDWRLTLT